MTKKDLDILKFDVSIKAKNGIDFILSATIVWLIIAYIWTLPIVAYYKSVLTFMVGGLMLPLAMMFSKLFKTKWKIEDNPLQPLGVWLNIAQLFYFPFLVFVLIKCPEYFIMTYAIITGAHFFPYAWYYNEKGYAIIGGLISIGALMLTLSLPAESTYLIGIFVSVSVGILALWIYSSFKRKLTLKN